MIVIIREMVVAVSGSTNLCLLFRKAKTDGIVATLSGAKELVIKQPKVIDLGKKEGGYGFRLKTEKVDD